MAKKPPPGKCVHCLKDFNELTWDHVLPVSWYPDTTPQNMEKWKIPACNKCNKEYGKLEEDLLWRLGLCIDPSDAKSSGIVEKTLRSINPLYATNRRDQRIRERKRNKILNELRTVDTPPTEGLFPNFGPQPNTQYPKYLMVMLSDEKLKSFIAKLVKGVNYIIDSSLLPNGYKIEIFFTHNDDAKPFTELIKKFGLTYYRGPGLTVGYAISGEDKNLRIFSVEIWGKLKSYAAIDRIKP